MRRRFQCRRLLQHHTTHLLVQINWQMANDLPSLGWIGWFLGAFWILGWLGLAPRYRDKGEYWSHVGSWFLRSTHSSTSMAPSTLLPSCSIWTHTLWGPWGGSIMEKLVGGAASQFTHTPVLIAWLTTHYFFNHTIDTEGFMGTYQASPPSTSSKSDHPTIVPSNLIRPQLWRFSLTQVLVVFTALAALKYTLV